MDTHTSAPPAAARAHFVDALRVLALGLLITYHVGMFYVPWDWHVKSVQPVPALVPWMWLAAPWRMTLLFVVAGMALALLVAHRGGPAGVLHERTKRLLLPLLCGVVLIVPPQSWLEVRQFHGYAGGYVEFLGLYFTADNRFCTPARGCLILPTWNHLWFLPYLAFYTALLLAALRRWPHLLDRAAARVARLGVLPWVLGPIAWFTLTRWVLEPHFGVTHALVDDLFSHAQHGFAFVFGAVLGTAGMACRPRIDGLRWPALTLALLCWSALLALPPGAARGLVWSGVQWCGVLAALGFAARHLDRDARWLRVLAPAVFPVYVLHQTITVVVATQLAPLALPPAIEGPLVFVATFGLGVLGYLLVRRVGPLRPWFGLPAARPRRAAPSGAVAGAATPAARV